MAKKGRGGWVGAGRKTSGIFFKYFGNFYSLYVVFFESIRVLHEQEQQLENKKNIFVLAWNAIFNSMILCNFVFLFFIFSTLVKTIAL